jgi:hypothetical protein
VSRRFNLCSYGFFEQLAAMVFCAAEGLAKVKAQETRFVSVIRLHFSNDARRSTTNKNHMHRSGPEGIDQKSGLLVTCVDIVGYWNLYLFTDRLSPVLVRAAVLSNWYWPSRLKSRLTK